MQSVLSGGKIEPDPAVLPGAVEALEHWSASVDLFARLVPDLVVVPVIVSGVLSPTALRSPLTFLRRRKEDREWLAATFQMMTPALPNVTTRIAFVGPSRRDSSMGYHQRYWESAAPVERGGASAGKIVAWIVVSIPLRHGLRGHDRDGIVIPFCRFMCSRAIAVLIGLLGPVRGDAFFGGPFLAASRTGSDAVRYCSLLFGTSLAYLLLGLAEPPSLVMPSFWRVAPVDLATARHT